MLGVATRCLVEGHNHLQEQIRQFLLATHVLAGFTALLSAAAAIASKKGRALHRTTGRVYSIAMGYIVCSAFPLAILRPNPFLFGVACFSGYLVWTGYRRATQRAPQLTRTDQWTVLAGGGVIAGMAIYGAYMLATGESLGVVSLAFAGGLTIFVAQDIQSLRSGAPLGKFRIARHLQRMLGGTIATITAVLVAQVVPQLAGTSIPPFVVWLLPTIALTPLIVWWSYKTLAPK